MSELDDIESAAEFAVAGPWAANVARFRAALLARWQANGRTLTVAEVRQLAAQLDTSPAQVRAAALLLPAAVVGDARVAARTAAPLPSAETVAMLEGTRDKPRAAVEEALRRAGGLDLTTVAGVLGVLGPLGASVNHMRGAASYAVQTAANEAVISAARQAGDDLVFVPERDACVECIKRGGQTGGSATVSPPPLHPFCRCELKPYSDPDVPVALARESIRSQLRGFSLPSESQAARLRAAKEALARRPQAPESVKQYARNAVERGKFGRSRSWRNQPRR